MALVLPFFPGDHGHRNLFATNSITFFMVFTAFYEARHEVFINN